MKLIKNLLHQNNNSDKTISFKEKESILPYGSSIILKKYPDTGGIIFYSIFHYKKQKHFYYIYINGKRKTKRYTKDDFILNLKGSWGYYPWFPEDGDHFINPSDLEDFKALKPYGKVFYCIDDDGQNVILKHKKMTFKVSKNLYKIINKPESINRKYDFPFNIPKESIIINSWGHYTGDKSIIFEKFLLKEPDKKEFFSNDGGIFHCIGNEENSIILKYYTFIFNVAPDLFKVIQSPLLPGETVILRNNPEIQGIITDFYWNYTCRQYIYILTINGKKKNQKFLIEDFIL